MKFGVSLQGETRGGFSLIEVTIAVSIFSVVGFGLFSAVKMSNDSQRMVTSATNSNEAMRKANSILSSELELAQDANITVVLLPDGNDQVTFMHPIVLAGTLGWGVFDPRAGATEAEQNKANWQIRYTVDSVVQGGQVNRRLVRQVLDDLGAIQESDVVMQGLRDGVVEPRGFSVARAGDMWEIRVTRTGTTEGSQGQGVLFHVKTRN